jgi:PAS domain S-box-containing protein
MSNGDRPLVTAPELIERLYSAGHRIAAAASFDDVLTALLDAAIADLAVDFFGVFVAQPQTLPNLTVINAWDRISGYPLAPGTFYTVGTGPALDFLKDGETILIDVADIDNDSRFNHEDRPIIQASNMNFVLMIPLIYKQMWVGLFTIGKRTVENFAPETMRLYQILADQAAAMFSARKRPPAPPTADEIINVVDTAEFYNSAIAQAGTCIITTDLTGVITHFNLAAETIYRYSAADLIGQNITKLIPHRLRSEYKQLGWAVSHEKRVIRADTQRLSKTSTALNLSISLSPILDSNGEVIGIAEFGLDLSEQTRTHTLIQKERDLFEAILETSNDAIVMIGTDRLVVTANLQFEAYFRLKRYELINRPVDFLLEQVRARPDLPGDLTNMLLTFAGDDYQSVAGDFEMMTPEWRVLIWYSTPVHSHDGSIVGRLFVFRDATRERQVDRMKTEFVSLVSHELRTPLTSIKGFTDFILDNDAGPIGDEVRAYLEIVKYNADRLTTLINDILDITRIEAGRVELRRSVQSIRAIIEDVVQTMQPILGERQQHIAVTVPQDLPMVWVDRDRIAQVITNLISNANKYTSSSGQITVEVYRVDSYQDLPEGSPSGVMTPALLIGIHDTGMGIQQQDQALIFTRFYRTEQAARRQISGTGLGLAIVKSFVELHSGHVWLYSKVDHGSSFYFNIPLMEIVT